MKEYREPPNASGTTRMLATCFDVEHHFPITNIKTAVKIKSIIPATILCPNVAGLMSMMFVPASGDRGTEESLNICGVCPENA
jgi:hypothetical protein